MLYAHFPVSSDLCYFTYTSCVYHSLLRIRGRNLENFVPCRLFGPCFSLSSSSAMFISKSAFINISDKLLFVDKWTFGKYLHTGALLNLESASHIVY